jgi:hypothetical protein
LRRPLVIVRAAFRPAPLVFAMAMAMAVALAACTVERSVPNNVLRCEQGQACPGGLVCTPSGSQMRCCLASGCQPRISEAGASGTGGVSGSGGAPATGGGDSGPATGGSGPATGGTGGSATDGGPGCTSECMPGQTRCVPGGIQSCLAPGPCFHWGPTGPAPANACTVQLIDDGIDERDLAVDCSGNLCLIGGITP